MGKVSEEDLKNNGLKWDTHDLPSLPRSHGKDPTENPTGTDDRNRPT